MNVDSNVSLGDALNDTSSRNPFFAFEDNYVFNLIRLVSRCFSKVRFHHLAAEETARITGNKIRRKLNKLILFNNQ